MQSGDKRWAMQGFRQNDGVGWVEGVLKTS